MRTTLSNSRGPQPTPRAISRTTFILSIFLVLVVGFILGTRSRDIAAAVGPLVGVKVDASQLDLSTTDQVYHLIKENYDGTVDGSKLSDGAAQGMTAALGDQFTEFFTKDQATQFDDSLNGRVSGIGAEISMRNSQPTITRVIDNSPAKAAGLQSGDQIVSVNGTSTDKATADKTASLVKGTIGTSVTLAISRSGALHTYKITRAEVTDPSVSSRMQGTVGILTIRRFDSDTGDLAQRMAAKLKTDGAKSIVLDLRDNGGGDLSQTGMVAGLWLDNGQQVVTLRTGKTIVDTEIAKGTPVFKGTPTVILANGNTASASEIVIGALHDNGVAKLLGEKTYGKGSAQKLFQLDNGDELKVTYARWYTPKGNNINGKGFTPDISVALSSADLNAGQDPQLDAALKQLQ